MVVKASAQRLSLLNEAFDLPGALYDQRRTRTAWFEGQHVTADQFNRDQSYHVTRQADLGRTIGVGVVEGFGVRPHPGSETTLIIETGLALAGSGEILSLPIQAQIDLADIASQRRLNTMLAGSDRAIPPPETRSGLFVLAASTVEYSSNPVGSYPVSATASRTLEDSLINEALLFTLSPFPVPAIASMSSDWRAVAAYRIFVEGANPDLPAAALPLAMVALQGNRVLWVDVPMVQRHCAPAAGDVFGLGLVDQTLRIAHYEQYDALIGRLITDTPAAALPASQLVMALPPMGRMPVGSVALRGVTGEPERLSQNWLPAVMPVELIALPEDEIEALLAESLEMPPIDLSADPALLANMPISIILPVSRAAWATTPSEVAEAALPLVPPPAVGGAPTDPTAMLLALIEGTPLPSPGDVLMTAAWRTLLGQARHLWFVRRRQFQRSDLQVAGTVTLLPDTGSSAPVVITPPAPIQDPLLPDPQAVALSDDLASGLGPLFEAADMRDVFGRQLELPLPDRLRLLIRQSQIAGAGGQTLVLAMANQAILRGAKVDDILTAFPLANAEAYAQTEPAIVSATALIRVALTQGQDTGPVVRIVGRLTGAAEDVLTRMLTETLSLTFSDPNIADPDHLLELSGAVMDAKASLSFAFADPMGKPAMEARRAMALSGAASNVAAALVRVKPDVRPKFVNVLQRAFADARGAPDDLGRKLIEQTRRVR